MSRLSPGLLTNIHPGTKLGVWFPPSRGAKQRGIGMNGLVGLLLALALLVSGCASGTSEDSRKDSSRPPEKKQGDGYGNY